MRKKTMAVIGLSALAVLFVFGMANAAKYGGCWIETRKVGYTTEMTTSYQSSPSEGAGGSVLLSQSLYTVLDTISADDSIYTRGIGRYYSKDSSGSDTTCLALDGFLGQTIAVNVFFMYSACDTVFMTVEQGMTYAPAAYDSAVAHSTTGIKYNLGFKTTDTLFVDSLVATLDSMIVIGTTDSCGMSRFYSDTFEVTSPYVRIKIKNLENVSTIDSPIHIELYVRNKDAVLGGASGRLQDRWQSKKSSYNIGR